VQELTSVQLAQACKGVISPEAIEELSAMPVDEALGFAFTLLIVEGGIEDPEAYLREKGVLK
jgi:hypothetical protein